MTNDRPKCETCKHFQPSEMPKPRAYSMATDSFQGPAEFFDTGRCTNPQGVSFTSKTGECDRHQAT